MMREGVKIARNRFKNTTLNLIKNIIHYQYKERYLGFGKLHGKNNLGKLLTYCG